MLDTALFPGMILLTKHELPENDSMHFTFRMEMVMGIVIGCREKVLLTGRQLDWRYRT